MILWLNSQEGTQFPFFEVTFSKMCQTSFPEDDKHISDAKNIKASIWNRAEKFLPGRECRALSFPENQITCFTA